MWDSLRSFEAGDFSSWLREGNFIVDPFSTFYTLLGIHSIGMAIVVGISFMLSSRIFGFQLGLSMKKGLELLPLAWWGFWINFGSGVLLVLAQPRREMMTFLFWAKMLTILLAFLSLRTVQRGLEAMQTPQGALEIAPWNLRLQTLLVDLFWLGAIISGRLIGYTQPPPPL